MTNDILDYHDFRDCDNSPYHTTSNILQTPMESQKIEADKSPLAKE